LIDCINTMSSNAAAIRRRATPPQTATNTSNPKLPTPPTSSAPNSNQMTLPQVIATVDKRLTQLEKITKENVNEDDNTLSVVVEEFNNRFEMIVTEINSLKDIIMKLQTFTMEVNKMLVDERIRVLSDLDNQPTTSSSDNQENTTTSANVKEMVESELVTND
jgi:hypothetical protein